MRKSIVVRRAAAALLAMAGIVLVACDSSESNETTARSTSETVRSYVGTVEGTEAFVSVVFDGARALVYVCDGVPADPIGTAPTIQAWFNGSSDGTTVDVQEPTGRLQLQLTESNMAGTLTLPDGRPVSVSGRSVATDGDAGLYRAEASGAGGSAVGGWILAADGQQRGGAIDNGGTTKISGVRVLSLSKPTFSPQGLASARIAKVGITPIPIP